MAKFGTSSSVDMFATTRVGDGVDVGTKDSPHASLGVNSLITYHFFFPLVSFPLESCDGGRKGLALPDDISIYTKIILQIINQIEY